MITLLPAMCAGMVPDIDLPLHCICASGNEILCVDRSVERYAILTRQAVTRGRITPHWRRLPGAFLQVDPLSPAGFALLYRRSKAGIIYANLRAGKLTESLIPAEIADSKNDIAEYVGRDRIGRPYACFGGGDLTPRMVRYDKRWREVGNPYLIGEGHVATNEILDPIRDKNGNITGLEVYLGSRYLMWRVPKRLTHDWLASTGHLSGCSPVVTAGFMGSENQRGQLDKSFVASLLESHQLAISRINRDLGDFGGGRSVIVLDPRQLLVYDGRFRILRLRLLWKS